MLEVARRLKLKRVQFSCRNFSLQADLGELEPAISKDEIEVPKVALPTEDELLYWSTDYEPNIKASEPE